MGARVRSATRLASWTEQDRHDATCSLTREDIAQARQGAYSPQQDLTHAATVYDSAIIARHPELRALVAAMRRRGIMGSGHLRTPPHDLAWEFKGLAQPYRDLVRRVMDWPFCWTTLFPRLTEDGWREQARGCASSSAFIESGGGWWLRRHLPEVFAEVYRATSALWDTLLGADGVAYASLPEVIAANLLRRNADVVTYEAHPRLPFPGPGVTRKQRHCVSDFFVQPRAGVPCRYPAGFYVELWMLPLDADLGRRALPRARDYLERRRHKTRQYAVHELALMHVECEIFRALPCARSFLDHIQHAVFAQTGLCLALAGVELPAESADRAQRPSLADIVDCFRAKGIDSMSAGMRSDDARVRMLAHRVREERLRPALERLLAVAYGRRPHFRYADAAARAAAKVQVAAYVREHALTKAAYETRFRRGDLPEGFPAAPGAAFAHWSWRAARCHGDAT